MPPSLRRLLFTVVALIAVLQTGVRGLGFILTRKDPTFCFYEEFERDVALELLYTITEVGDFEGTDTDWYNRANFTVKNLQTGHLLADQLSNHQGRVAFSTHEGGKHEICVTTVSSFPNTKHVGSQKVTIDIVHTSVDLLHHKPHLEVASKFHSNILQLMKAVSKISDEMELQIARQHELELISSLALTKVRNWALLAILLFALFTVWQIFHLRKFFISKKIV